MAKKMRGSYQLYNTREHIDGGWFEDPKAMLRKWYRLGGRANGWRMFEGDSDAHNLVSEEDIEAGLVKRNLLIRPDAPPKSPVKRR